MYIINEDDGERGDGRLHYDYILLRDRDSIHHVRDLVYERDDHHDFHVHGNVDALPQLLTKATLRQQAVQRLIYHNYLQVLVKSVSIHLNISN